MHSVTGAGVSARVTLPGVLYPLTHYRAFFKVSTKPGQDHLTVVSPCTPEQTKLDLPSVGQL
jgi:hypothetical protein